MNDNTLDESGRMTTVSIVVDQSLIDALDEEARAQDRSRSWIARKAFEDYLAARAAVGAENEVQRDA